MFNVTLDTKAPTNTVHIGDTDGILCGGHVRRDRGSSVTYTVATKPSDKAVTCKRCIRLNGEMNKMSEVPAEAPVVAMVEEVVKATFKPSPVTDKAVTMTTVMTKGGRGERNHVNCQCPPVVSKPGRKPCPDCGILPDIAMSLHRAHHCRF